MPELMMLPKSKGWFTRRVRESDLAPEHDVQLGPEGTCDGAPGQIRSSRKAWQIVRRQAIRGAATPSSRGWGPGWPNCQYSKWRTLTRPDGIKFVLHMDALELFAWLIDWTERQGYNLIPGQCWGAACRAIRGSSSPSNHSWALAVDLNSLANPMGSTLKTNIPMYIVLMWEKYMMRWGGRYTGRKDAMHFEFMGSPADAKRLILKARAELAPEEEDDMAALFKDKADFEASVRKIMDEDPIAKAVSRKGWRYAIWKALYKQKADKTFSEHLNLLDLVQQRHSRILAAICQKLEIPLDAAGEPPK